MRQKLSKLGRDPTVFTKRRLMSVLPLKDLLCSRVVTVIFVLRCNELAIVSEMVA